MTDHPEKATKRPLTPYFIFHKENFDKVKKENPEMKIGKIASAIGKMWKELSDDEKKRYGDESKQLFKEYHEQQKYETSGTKVEKQSRGSSRTKSESKGKLRLKVAKKDFITKAVLKKEKVTRKRPTVATRRK